MSVLGGAFFIMDYLPGSLLVTAHPDTVPELMGKTHAALHQIDPEPLTKELQNQGVDAYGYSLESRFAWLEDRASKLPWARESVNWLVENRPPEPEQLAVCHGDFHPLNILVDNGQVTGVLDWGGFAVTDPIYDVANSVVISTIPAKHLLGSMAVYADVDWENFASSYLSAYLSENPLDLTCLDYYRVRRCVMSLIQGIEGQAVWQHPGVVADVVECIRTITGIQVEVTTEVK
jgi:aminoglycoside phosphotransferase (APT) family kinase protein